MVMCYLLVKYPVIMVPVITNTSEATMQGINTHILAAGYGASRDVDGKDQLVKMIVPFLTSNSALVRAQAQYWLSEISEDALEDENGLLLMRTFLKTNKDIQAVFNKMRPVFARLDPIRLIDSEATVLAQTLWTAGSHSAFMEEIKMAVREGMTEVVLTHDERAILEEQRKFKSEDAVASGPSATLGNFQRKYDPKEQTDFPESRKSKKTDLVILASLLDKPTNIAGLSRTAEIFGARKLLIANEKMLADREFKAMSMTSEKWLDIEEVRVENVKEEIRNYRNEGYAIVALEQTSSSVVLGEWQFPQKTLLILGNEGQGIPVWCLAEIDTTVEIPQIGVVRSLNVHVSAALAVWEYNRSWAGCLGNSF
jgi:tRNA G18 (ribose-2'-O)-methylase SpoU